MVRQLFQALSPCDYKNVMRVVETAILSTDLAMYFKKKSKFLDLVDNGEFDWQSPEKKECKAYIKNSKLYLNIPLSN